LQKIRKKRKRVSDAALRKAFIFTIVFIIFVLLFGGTAILVLLYGQGSDKPGEKSYVSAPPRELSGNVLLIGGEKPSYDLAAFMLMRLDFEQERITVTALPAALSVTAGNKTASLREQMRYGGTVQVKRGLENLFDIEIEHTGLVHLGSFESIIDQLGGVHYQIPRQITFADEDGIAGMTLEPGLQKLTGAMVVQLMKYKDWPEGEAYRLQVQENIATGLINQYLKKDFLNRQGISVFRFASNSLTTDFSMTDYMVRLPGFLQLAEKQNPALARSVTGAFSQSEPRSFTILPSSVKELHEIYAPAKAS